MAEPLDMVREELRKFIRENQDDVFHINELTDFAEEAFENPATKRSPASAIRNALKELHHQGEITYVTGRRYRIEDESLKTSEEDSVELDVTVEDPDGTPVEAAEIRAEAAAVSAKLKTNAEGVCKIEIPEPAGELDLIVEKSGFLIDKSRIKFHGKRKQFWLTLEPLPDGRNPPSHPVTTDDGSAEMGSSGTSETNELDDILEEIMQDFNDDL